MATKAKFSELKPQDDFYYLVKGRRTRFRKISSPGNVPGLEEFAEMNAIQLGGGDGLLSLTEFSQDEEVLAIQ